jgi:hypothetical protein
LNLESSDIPRLKINRRSAIISFKTILISYRSETVMKPYRQAFIDNGFSTVEEVLSKAEAEAGAKILLEHIRPESPESYAHLWGTRRQLKTPQHSIPDLARYALHPKLLDVISHMIDGSFRLSSEPIPVVTFPGDVCGCLSRGNWRGHTDGFSNRPFLEREGSFAHAWLTFADIEPGGGAMTAVPGSQYFIDRAVKDPKFRAEKEERNSYNADENYDGLDWNPVEITAKAGGVFFYDGQVIHSASDNLRDQPRLVCLYNYSKRDAAESRETIESRFNPEHLKVMDAEMRRLIGLE